MKNRGLQEAMMRWNTLLDTRDFAFSFHAFLFFLLIIVTLFFSCTDSEDTAVGFETSGVQRTESDSTYSVRIHLGKVTAATTVTIDIFGTAALDGDYQMTVPVDLTSSLIPVTGSSSVSSQQVLTVQAGNSYVDLFFKIIDDPYVEPRAENIYFRISDISNESIAASVKNLEYQFVIVDNDKPPADAMRVDLSWRLGDGISITNGNVDMYLATNVVVSNGLVVSRDLVASVSSTNETGFETFTIGSSVPDGKYYIMVRYVSGSYDADTELVMSKGTSYTRATARITAANVGKDFYFGPLTKSGSSYSRVEESAVEEEPKFIY